jgi:hypothetical protein
MPARITATTVHLAGTAVPLQAFTELANEHLRQVADTRDLEARGRRLRSAGFPSADLDEFIRRVCRWGGWAGIAGRVARDNTMQDIRFAFVRAATVVATATDDALREVNRLRGLGQPSYASKHLRFVAPEHCGVLDNLVAKTLDYNYDADGYAELSNDLRHLGKLLTSRGVMNPMRREGGAWWPADVDLAIFAWIRRHEGTW